MSIDDSKIARAIEDVGARIDMVSDPKEMNREEAFEFYDALIEEIEEKRRTLKAIADG